MAITVDKSSLGTLADIASASTAAITTSQIVAAGATIFLGVGWWANAAQTVTSVSGGGLTWTIDKQGKNSGANPASAIIRADAPSGLASGTTITVALSAAAPARFVGSISLVGLDVVSLVDATGTTQSANAAAWTTGSIALTAGSVLFGCSFNESATSSTPTSPAVEVCDLTASSNATTLAYRIETSAASYTVAGTWDVSGQNVTNGVAYLAAAATAVASVIRTFNPIPFMGGPHG